MNRPPKKTPRQAQPKLPADYYAQIEALILKARAWSAAHAGAAPKVQFNWPAGVHLMAALDDAIKNHYVSVNEDGRAMLDAMREGLSWEMEPTAFMIRMALELIDDPRV